MRISDERREQIGVRHPLLAGEPAAEVVGDGRQRDVDGRGVHCHHGRPQDGRRESAALGVHLRRTLQRAFRRAASVRAMLAYVFWHVPYAGIARPDYEARLAAFHAALRAHPPAWLGPTATFGLAEVPWLGGAAGYEDWYLVEDFTALGELNVAAVTGARQPPHDAAAAGAELGAAGVMAHVAGPLLPAEPGWSAWFAKPAGRGVCSTSTPSWRRSARAPGSARWCSARRRSTACSRPRRSRCRGRRRGSGRCGRWSRRRAQCSASHATRSASTRPRSGSRSLNSSWKRSS